MPSRREFRRFFLRTAGAFAALASSPFRPRPRPAAAAGDGIDFILHPGDLVHEDARLVVRDGDYVAAHGDATYMKDARGANRAVEPFPSGGTSTSRSTPANEVPGCYASRRRRRSTWQEKCDVRASPHEGTPAFRRLHETSGRIDTRAREGG